MPSLFDVFSTDPVSPTQPEPDQELEKMRKMCQEQEAKVEKLMENKTRERPKLSLITKRKISECTEAPNSPVRKTKLVKKDSK